MKVAIIYDVLGWDGGGWRVGGIQTYVRYLAELCADSGWEAVVFQPASRDFETLAGRVRVRGIAVAQQPKTNPDFARGLLPAIHAWAGNDKLVVIFGQVDMAMPIPGARTIGIQHGIYWDIDTSKPQVPWTSSLHAPAPPPGILRRLAAGLLHQTPVGRWLTEARAYRRLQEGAAGYEDVDIRVCVDHNFPNWYRTLTRNRSGKPEYVIINPAEIATREQLAGRTKNQEDIRILFARRLFWYRGTGIMAEAGKRLLAEHKNIRITFAGEGPDREVLQNYFSGESRVQFACYRPEESLQIHLAHDVAVNASLGSEGSSLSVGEAMGAGCAVVATGIGGVTNMIIDGFNGILVNPDAESLYRGLSQVVLDGELRSRLGCRAWQTAGEAFSVGKWGQQWREIIHRAVIELE